jgi:hypothetical protein
MTRAEGRRRALEVALWIVAIGFFWVLDTLTKLDERRRTGVGLDDFRLATEQATSALAVLLMIAFVVFWLDRFPLDRQRIALTLLAHSVGSALFATGHYALLVIFRKVVFSLNGMQYMPGQNHFANLVYEYKKDIKIYLFAIAIVTTYRYFRDQQRLSGALSRTTPSEPPAPADRKLAVKTRKGERLIDIEAIDYLQAAGNYVEVHSAGERFLVRSALGALAERLPSGGFLRTHRSLLVNVAAVVESRGSGAAQELVLRNDATIPVSRSYRDGVKQLLEDHKL